MPKLTLDQVLKNFHPDFKPRDIQVAALEKTIESYNNGAEYVALEVPVGGGKSLLAMALAKTLGSSYALTLTEQLQMQYLKDFQSTMGMEALKGRGKYECNKAGQGFSCADGKTMFEGKNACKPDVCTYQLAKARALAAPHTVANYHSYAFNLGMSAGKKKPKRAEDSAVPLDAWPASDAMRDITIIDECHAAESFLLDLSGVTVRLDKLTGFKLDPLPVERDENNIDVLPYFAYIENSLLPKLVEYVALQTKRGILDPRTKDELGSLVAKLRTVIATKDENWVAEREPTNDGKGFRPDTFSMKPLKVAHYGPWLTGFGRFKLLMSGTILNPYQMVTSIGLDPEKGDFHTFDSPFPAENRPVYVGNLDMGFKARDESWPVMVEQVKALLTSHATQKGILLAPSNKMLFYITKELAKTAPALARRILIAQGDDRMKKYHEHCASPQPTVLGASGFWEGADLKGKLSEFQIIPQLPRPMFQGQIRARANIDRGWYDWLTFTKLLQGLGRSVRSETDVAVTYVLDRAFRSEFKKKDSLIPLWVKSSVQLVD